VDRGLVRAIAQYRGEVAEIVCTRLVTLFAVMWVEIRRA
jgi:hypothetical protein